MLRATLSGKNYYQMSNLGSVYHGQLSTAEYWDTLIIGMFKFLYSGIELNHLFINDNQIMDDY